MLSFGAAAAFAAGWCVPAASGPVPRQRARAAAGAGAAAVYALFAFAVHRLGTLPVGLRDGAPLPLSGSATRLAEAGWTAYVRAVSHPMTAGELLAKIAVYALLVTILVVAARSQRAAFVPGANSVGAGASRA